MFELKDLSIKVKDRYLVKDLSLVLNKKDKLAIIGEEGNGKSTLLKVMLGICDYATISGTINFKGNRVGYLEQSISSIYFDKKVYDFLFHNEDEYYEKVNRLYKYFDVINLSDAVLEQIISTLSGGERVKIGILKLLIDDDDILFLDEPTNDLDIETLEWLEHFINDIDVPIIFVSHDETLLSNTANMILHLEQIKKKTDCRHTLLRIGYDSYVDKRLRKLDKETQLAKYERREFNKQQEKLRRVMQKVEYQQNTISRSDPHGARLLKKKMHSLKSQEKRLETSELAEVPDVEEGIVFCFEDVLVPRMKSIIKLDVKELKIEKRVLARNISLDVVGNQHLCIIGKNGVGKSTLIKVIYDELRKRDDFNVSYISQDYDDVFYNYQNVLDFICPSGNKDDVTRARMYLGNMKFTKEEMEGKIGDLSNGTKAKLLLTKSVLDKPDVLILDEPTRNVSPLSNPVIRKVLKEYKGTIISVSHDRKYIDEVVDSLYILTGDGLVSVAK